MVRRRNNNGIIIIIRALEESGVNYERYESGNFKECMEIPNRVNSTTISLGS